MLRGDRARRGPLPRVRRATADAGAVRRLARLHTQPRRLPRGHPHHLHELTSEEFETALNDRFAHVRILRQQSHVASLLAGREATERVDSGAALDVDVRIAAAPPEEDLYVVGAASNEALPPLPEILVLGRAIDLAKSMDDERAAKERALLAEAQAAADRAIAATAMAGQERALRERDEAQAQRETAARELADIRATRWWRAGAPVRWLRRLQRRG